MLDTSAVLKLIRSHPTYQSKKSWASETEKELQDFILKKAENKRKSFKEFLLLLQTEFWKSPDVFDSFK